MTKTKNYRDRAVKLCISLDPASFAYLESLDGDRSGNIVKAIAKYREMNDRRAYLKHLKKRSSN
jgi:hypothetical protein